MALSAANIRLLDKIESQAARLGFKLGSLLQSAIGTDLATAQTDISTLQGGKFSHAAPNTETSSANGGAISVALLQTLISSAGAETRTLAAPGAGNVGRLKVISMSVDGGDVTLAGTNILGQEALTGTFDDAGDTLVLYAATATKWVILGSNVTFA